MVGSHELQGGSGYYFYAQSLGSHFCLCEFVIAAQATVPNDLTDLLLTRSGAMRDTAGDNKFNRPSYQMSDSLIGSPTWKGCGVTGCGNLVLLSIISPLSQFLP